MDNFLENKPSSVNGVSTWKQIMKMPGGKLSLITGAGVIAVCIYYFFKALPFLIAGVANTAVFIAELVGLALFLMIITSKNFWKWIALFWAFLNKKILGIFVKIDSVSILENGIRRLKDQYDSLVENVTKLGGILEQMKRDLNDYENEFKRNVTRRSAIQKKLASTNLSQEEALQTKSSFIITNNEIARLEKVIINQKKRIETSERYLQVMKKLKIMSMMKVKDAENEMRWKKQEFEQAKKQRQAMSSIRSIFSGGLAKTLEEEMALDYINENITTAVAEMQSLLDGSETLLNDFDMDSLANVEAVDRILEKFEKNGFSSFGNNDNAVDAPYVSADQRQMLNDNSNNNLYGISNTQKEPIALKNKYF